VRQRIGAFISKLYIYPISDGIFIAGTRQRIFAKKIGFHQQNIIEGVYSCDHKIFSEIYFRRNKREGSNKKFVYIGRFSQEKDINTLIKAYLIYRQQSSSPWPLICYGTGPLKHLAENIPGITLGGFVQPNNLPALLLSAGCLILPSKFEPWGVVVHEAVSSGLPVICSDAVGSSDDLVVEGGNGFIFKVGNEFKLAHCMLKMSSLSRDQLQRMSNYSFELSKKFTPELWVSRLLDGVKFCREK
jgi:glycosyltransferase involved in cell wall biosynthesis